MRTRYSLSGAILGVLLVGCISYTSAQDSRQAVVEKKASPITLRSTEAFGEDWAARADMPVFRDLDGAPLEAGLYQNKDKLRLAFRLMTTAPSGAPGVEVVLAFDPVYFFIKGSPILVDTSTGDRREVDYRFEGEKIICKSVRATDHLKYIELDVCSRKLRNRGELTIEDRLKQARTIRRIRQRTDSWSALAPDQIIAQETLRPIVCHGGYDVRGVKHAVIWANGIELTGEFELIDALHNRQHPARQPVIYRGPLQETGSHVWGGNNYVADFSDFKEEGLYFIRLRVAETKEVTDSYVFPIRKSLYLDLARKAGHWFYYQRCGMEVPGFHEACHTQDAIIKTDGTRVDVTGGWHDAGDYGKWTGGGAVSIMALATLEDEFGRELDETLGGMPRFLNEAAWEAEYLCKGYWDGRFHAGFTSDFEDVCTWLGAPEAEPPRVVLEEDMLKYKYGYSAGPGLSWTSSCLARTGRLLLAYDEELAQRCISVAEEVYELDLAVDLSKPAYEEKQNSYLWLQAGLLMSDIELHKISKDNKYKDDAKNRVENILALQDEEGWFYFDQARTSDKYAECRFHLFALYEFLKHNPASELNSRIKNTFRRWADYNMRFAHVSNFGQIGGVEEDGRLRNLFESNYRNRRVGGFAWGLATAAILLEEPRYLEMAERQIQWIAGLNPADVSMMAGVGKGPGCYHHRYSFMEGCEDGVVPGGILNGIESGNGDLVYLGDLDTKNFVIAEVPPDYPLFDTDVWGWTYSYATNEYWTRNSAWFIMGAFQVEKALRELR
ncbi:MAG: glycoside hydrolase family 9 protein [Phycisphaerales bacterium]|nr:glycoside hydrolase family 9 protein [Phycisphaerales bacterium]